MTKVNIAKAYIEELEQGNVKNVVKLFASKGIVDSPIYGVMPATEFYLKLMNDTNNSKLEIKGIFEEENSKNLALYFTYTWTLRSKDIVSFDVVDIISFNNENKIERLKIIYDTVTARKLVNALEKK